MPEIEADLYLTIAKAGKEKTYRVTRLDSDPGTVSWALSTKDSEDAEYRVHQDAAGAVHCDCRDAEFRHRACKHGIALASVRLLRRVGVLAKTSQHVVTTQDGGAIAES